MRKLTLFFAAFLLPLGAMAQEGDGHSGVLSLKQCVDYAVENNVQLQKDRLGVEVAVQSRPRRN